MSTYSPNLRIELITDGTQAGTWGSTTNGSLAYVLDSSIAGYQTVSVTAANQYLTYTNGATATVGDNQSVYAMLRFTTTTGAAFNVYALPSVSKQYLIWNNSGYSMTIYNSTAAGGTTALGTGVTIANGDQVLVWTNGTNFYELKTGNVTGTVAIANGGTGQTTASAAITALLPSQTGNVNKYLQTNGTVASWDAVSLSTSDITGTLAVANGGTGGADAATARTNLVVPSTTGSGASGTWGISISGNAATATNGLTTGNYNSYAPTLTGTGASGTWGISISGNAATATNATNATNATDATTAQNTRLGGGNVNDNIANGTGALDSNVNGSSLVAMGWYAGSKNTSGFRNIYIGAESGWMNHLGDYNVFVGDRAGYSATRSDADYNCMVGAVAGVNNVGSYQATYIGGGAGQATAYFNVTALGYSSTNNQNNQVQLGNSSTTTYVYGTVQNRSDLRDKTDVRDTTLGTNFIMSLRPVDYKWDMRDDYKPAMPLPPKEFTGELEQANYQTELTAWREASKLGNIVRDGSKKRTRYHHGFIAQEVMALNSGFGGVQDATVKGGEEILALGYDELIAPLVKAFQELKTEFDAYKAAHP